MKQDVDGNRSRGAAQGGWAETGSSPITAGTVRQDTKAESLDAGPLTSFVAIEDALHAITIPTGLTSAAEESPPALDSPTADSQQPYSSSDRHLDYNLNDAESRDGAEAVRSGEDHAKAPRRRGVCKFFNAQKGFGFVLDDYADELGGVEVFVHYTAIASVKGGPNGFKSLAEGETVEYSIAPGPKGWQAQDVTGPSGGPCVGCPPHTGGPSPARQAKVAEPQRKSVRPATTARRMSSLRLSPDGRGERRHSRSSADSVGRKSDKSTGAVASLAVADGHRGPPHDPYRPVLIQAYAYSGPGPQSPTHYTVAGVPGGLPDGAMYDSYPHAYYGETRPSQAPAPNLAFYPSAGLIHPHVMPHPSIHVHTPVYPSSYAGSFIPASPIYHSFPPTSPHDPYQPGLPSLGTIESVYPISHQTSQASS